MNLNKFILYLGSFILMINLILHSRSFKIRFGAFRIFCLYLLFAFILQLASHLWAEIFKDNLFLSHYYFIGQFIILSLFYYRLTQNKVKRIVVRFTAIVILIIVSLLFINDPKIYFRFSVLEIVLCSVPIIIYSVLYMFQSIAENKKSLIFVNSGIFIYMLCSTLIFSSGNIMPNLDPSINVIIWKLNEYIFLLYQILIFVEWYKHFRKPEVAQ